MPEEVFQRMTEEETLQLEMFWKRYHRQLRDEVQPGDLLYYNVTDLQSVLVLVIELYQTDLHKYSGLQAFPECFGEDQEEEPMLIWMLKILRSDTGAIQDVPVIDCYREPTTWPNNLHLEQQ